MTETVKIVYNGCYGGFALSRKAVLRAREISGNPKWGGPTIKGDVYEEGTTVDRDYGFVDDNIERHDPVLVQIVEELGKEADGRSANLCIEEVPKGTLYRITEYDGFERVETSGDIDWKIAQ